MFVTVSAQYQRREEIGFPAFDASKQLVVFFREAKIDVSGGVAGATLKFLPLDAARNAGLLSVANVSAVANALKNELEGKSLSVIQMDAIGNLMDMKAKALSYSKKKADSGLDEFVYLNFEALEKLGCRSEFED